MRILRRYRKIVVMLLTAAILAMHVPLGAAQAAMVGTDEVVVPAAQVQQQQVSPDRARARVGAALEREDVQAQLRAWGIGPDEAKRRIAALSDAEIAMLSDRIADDPAGQGVIGTLLVIAVLGFLVLVITDLVGATDVFPFIHSRAERQ
jgi:hypothetical protein